MKKSELKEMIRQGMFEDAQSTLPNNVKESIKGIGSDGSYNYELEDTLGDLIDNKDQAIDVIMYIASSWGINIPSNLTEAKDDKKEEEEEDIEIEDIEGVEDVEIEDTEEEEISTPSEEGISGDEKKVQDSLESALIAAKELGDEKLINQIGNSITFFTRSHVVGSGEENLEEDFISEDKQELNENKYVVLSLIDDLNKYMNGDLDKKDIQSSIEIFSTELRNSLFEDENIEEEVEESFNKATEYGIDNYKDDFMWADYSDIGQFSIDPEILDKFSGYDLYLKGMDIVKRDYNGNVGKAYEDIVQYNYYNYNNSNMEDLYERKKMLKIAGIIK